MTSTTTHTNDASPKAEAQKSDQQSTLAAAQESVSHAAEATRAAVSDATHKTVDAAKGNPKTAAAIAVGAAAVIAGAAFGASKLLKSDGTSDDAADTGKTKTTKAKA